ncbi:MMPL family transporter [Mycobacterium sp.]|uniref:MMPL family transporter n=1 Tax=Mycobacterium sp. TaxID=1785 RepID=UPI002D44DEA6|nr:MMPL family transporter [Mycobacterium sp.]HZA08650.1 MMPL family transporter [Mycobacterium sp.]
MLEGIARLAIRAPRRIIAIAVLALACTALFGIPVAKSLSPAGFQDPTAESAHATNLLSSKFGQGDMQMLITVGSNGGAQSEAARAVGTDIVRQLQNSPYVAQVTSAWTAPPSASGSLISKDGKTGLIVAGITGGQNSAPQHAETLSKTLVHDRDGVIVRAGGQAMTYTQINLQTQKDLRVMESIAIPLSFLVLVWVFGGLVAAALPLAVGGLAIFGSMAVLRAITYATDVSIFALNLSVAMGLALAIDYTLLIISRFRDELATGAGRDEALMRTMATAGRTVLFSAMTVALSMSVMVLFPMYFLRSFAYAGVAVVALAAVAAIVVTPAAIALLGERLDSLDIHRLVRTLLHRPEPVSRPVQQHFFYRLAKFVMRRAIPIGLAIIALLVTLGIPFLSAKWGLPDDRALPTSSSARQVGDQLRTDFADDLATNVTVVITDTSGVTAAEMGRYAARLSQVPDVSSVSAPDGTFVTGGRAGPPAAATGMREGSAFLTVASTAPLYSQASATQLDRLQAVPGPAGRPALLTGTAPINRDTAHAVTSRAPIVLAVIAAITFVLMLLMTGSVILPLKTLLLNVLSLTAAFGALVWIFQDGHLGALGTTVTGTLVVTIPVLLFCIAFGLSMDYEVMLVSRIREHWLASNRTQADNDESVALGMAHTGRVITAAALIMSISFAAMIAAQVSFMRMFGVGLTLAVLGDATLVRMLLVPAFMHVMGRFNWWAPKPLARLQERFPMSESDHPLARPAATPSLR